jgi:glycosyltransferase involved in cell wall biosynthesis
MNGAIRPTVSIGIPVYNGEKYLRQALDSLLAQTYQDFELVISDNASTDRTGKICEEYRDKDPRIRYYRNQVNAGAPLNFNRVFELSKGEYFKWAAYDDLHGASFLEKCVRVLDQDPSVVLCHSKTGRIDENGTFLGNYDRKSHWEIDSEKTSERFRELISIGYPKGIIYGVGRVQAIRKTRLLGTYVGADRNLMAEIGLTGRIVEIPEYLFFRRDHPEAYTYKYCKSDFATSADKIEEQSSFWSKGYCTYYPNWKDCIEFFKSVNHMSLSLAERIACYDEILHWFIKEGWQYMAGDIENLLMRRSMLARKILPLIKSSFKIGIKSFIG